MKVTPAGRPPISLSAGAGIPVAVTRNFPGSPTENETADALVMAGARGRSG
jgi:hypothetical protein